MRSRYRLPGSQTAIGILPAETTPFPAKSWRWHSRSTILEGTKFLSWHDKQHEGQTKGSL
jgi:hypothetical protein